MCDVIVEKTKKSLNISIEVRTHKKFLSVLLLNARNVLKLVRGGGKKLKFSINEKVVKP